MMNYDELYTPGGGYTLAGCLGICTDKRSLESKWNSVHFRPSDGWCDCVKNDVGHNPSIFKDCMHFKS